MVKTSSQKDVKQGSTAVGLTRAPHPSQNTGRCSDQVTKRKRRSTGGTFDTMPETSESSHQGSKTPILSTGEFKTLSIDDKLVALFTMMSKVDNVDIRVQQVERQVNQLQNEHVGNKKRMKILEYKSIDAEARARRNNLIFRGIAEVFLVENCKEIAKAFIRNELGIDPSTMCIQRAHRIGRLSNRSRGKTRPLKVCFRDYKDVDLVLLKAHR